MAELNKKLYIYKSSNGSTSTAKLYTTTAESGSGKFATEVDGITAYAAISGANPTPLKLQDTAGTTHTIYGSAKPAYGYVLYNTSGTYSFTVPSGVTTVRVTVVGAGGGAAASYSEYYDSSYFWAGNAVAGTGGTSSAFGVSASGGGGGSCTSNANNNGTVTVTGGSGGSPNGRSGGSKTGGNTFGSSIASASGGTGFGVLGGTYGTGGSVTYNAGGSNEVPYVAGGGSGGYQYTTVSVTTGAAYPIVVGAGGSLSRVGGSHDDSISSGTSGCVLVEYGGDI